MRECGNIIDWICRVRKATSQLALLREAKTVSEAWNQVWKEGFGTFFSRWHGWMHLHVPCTTASPTLQCRLSCASHLQRSLTRGIIIEHQDGDSCGLARHTLIQEVTVRCTGGEKETM